MSTYIQQLIELYAENDVEAINQDESLLMGVFGRSASDLSKDDNFTTEQAFVAELKSKIEGRRDKFKTPDQEARIAEGLLLLLDLAMYDPSRPSTKTLRMNTLQSLIETIYGKAWNKNQLAHFKFVSDLLKEWKTYFLSYTNHDPEDINNKYRAVIERHVSPGILRERDSSKDNLLAEAIVQRLKKENIRGSFYDKENIRLADVIKNKIESAAAGTFAFVQLVQYETFVLDDPNWCFEEYKIFEHRNQEIVTQYNSYQPIFRKRFNAILAEEEVPAGLPMLYGSWRNRIFKEQHYETIPTDPAEFREKIHTLASEIINLQKQIIDSVPS